MIVFFLVECLELVYILLVHGLDWQTFLFLKLPMTCDVFDGHYAEKSGECNYFTLVLLEIDQFSIFDLSALL